MTGEELRANLIKLGLTQAEFGRVHVGKSERQIRRYVTSLDDVPMLVAQKVEGLMLAHDEDS